MLPCFSDYRLNQCQVQILPCQNVHSESSQAIPILFMSLELQTIIALITLIISCPPTLWLLHVILNRHRHGNTESKQWSWQSENTRLHLNTDVLPLHIEYPETRSIVMIRPQQRMWSFESEQMMGFAASALTSQ